MALELKSSAAGGEVMGSERITSSVDSPNEYQLSFRSKSLAVSVSLQVRDSKSVPKWPVSDYNVFLLDNPLVIENDVFLLRLRGKPIGWLIPILSIDSTYHGYSTKKPFLDVYPTARNALLSCPWEDKAALYEVSKSSYSFSDFYKSSEVLCLLHKPELVKHEVAEPWTILPTLTSLGFWHSRESNRVLERGSHVRDRLTHVRSQVAIELDEVSFLLHDDSFVRSLIHNPPSRGGEPVYNFLTYYQIVELMLDIVYEFERRELLSRFGFLGHDPSSSKDCLAAYTSLASEKNRIEYLFSRYVDSGFEKGTLNAALGLFLNDIGNTENLKFPANLYKVRNMVVHSSRKLSSAAINSLAAINEVLEVTIFDILCVLSTPEFAHLNPKHDYLI